MKRDDLVMVRDARPADKNFIYKTWMRGLYYGSPFFNAIEPSTFYKNYQGFLDELFNEPLTLARVACLKEDEDVVLGYCVYEPNLLHWVYVKKSWRRIGLAKMLVNFPVHTITHLTTQVRGLTLKHNFKFNPFR